MALKLGWRLNKYSTRRNKSHIRCGAKTAGIGVLYVMEADSFG